eukprot:7353812-Pyramimonas_sp.AAC.2
MAVPLIKHNIIKKKKNQFKRNQSDRKVTVPVRFPLYFSKNAMHAVFQSQAVGEERLKLSNTHPMPGTLSRRNSVVPNVSPVSTHPNFA